MTQAVDQFLRYLDTRLTKGARDYGDRSLTRPITTTEREIKEELSDQVGWVFVMWTDAARRAWSFHYDDERTELDLRAEFFAALRQRILRNDRGRDQDAPASNAGACMCDLECLAVDMFTFAEHVKQRLHPIARALEVARWMRPARGRRGGGSSARTY